MRWIINFPSYYSPHLFQNDAYCLINDAQIPCVIDSNAPYQLIISESPVTVNAGTSYTLSVLGLSAPRSLYTNDEYPQRYIFVGVLVSSDSTAFVERNLILPYQTIQSTVTGIVRVEDMVGISVSSLFAFSSLYAQFKLICSVDISSGSYLYLDLPL